MQLFASPAKVAGRGHGHRREFPWGIFPGNLELGEGGHRRDIEMSYMYSHLILASWYILVCIIVHDDVGNII